VKWRSEADRETDANRQSLLKPSLIPEARSDIDPEGSRLLPDQN
jgi:hypothetical protein